MFKPVSNKVAFPKMEEEVLAFWEKDGTFKKSLKKNEGKERYKFYDGPPFATGLPHYGHLLAGTIKDIVPRYQTMRGKYVERRFGWDTHGLPIEALAQDYDGKAIVGKCDVEEDEDLAMRFGIRSVPTIVFLKDGKEKDRVVGAAARPVFDEKIQALL